MAKSGLCTGRQRHREGLVSAGWCRRWQWQRALVTAVAQGGSSSGAVKLSKTRARVGKALRRLGRGGDEVNE